MNKTPFFDLNESIKKIELEKLEKNEIYPVVIILDRYNGCYSGGKWLAFQLNSDEIPDEIGGGDPDEEHYWRDVHSDENLPCGKGNTPDEALSDLKIKAKKFYESW